MLKNKSFIFEFKYSKYNSPYCIIKHLNSNEKNNFAEKEVFLTTVIEGITYLICLET